MSESQLTVEELINVLKKFPQNFRVMVYRYNGNYEEQEPVSEENVEILPVFETDTYYKNMGTKSVTPESHCVMIG